MSYAAVKLYFSHRYTFLLFPLSGQSVIDFQLYQNAGSLLRESEGEKDSKDDYVESRDRCRIYRFPLRVLTVVIR